MIRLIIFILILVVSPIIVFADNQEFIMNEYAQIEGTPLIKDKLKKLEYYLSGVEKYNDEQYDYEAIGVLGNKETIKYLKEFLEKNKNNTTYRYDSFIRYYIFGSLVMLGEYKYIDYLIEGLSKDIPEYEDWIKKGCINGNANSVCSEVLRRLSVYKVPFGSDQIEKMIKALNHPDHSVNYNIMYVLNKNFGILFVGGIDNNNLWYKSKEARVPGNKAWEKFWQENKSRYGKNLPLIINGLELQAKFKTDKSIEIVIKNYDDKNINIFMEAPGKIEGKNPNHLQEWLGVIGIIVDGNRKSPIVPRNYIHSCSIRVGINQGEFSAPLAPDRPVHIEKITIAPGNSYDYVMNLDEAYPDTEFKGKKLRVEYKAITYHADPLAKIFRDEKIWEGELQSIIFCRQ
ncbi:MAG: hypothetical protein WC317_07320 [Candidatus Omnitrophota bacterium]